MMEGVRSFRRQLRTHFLPMSALLLAAGQLAAQDDLFSGLNSTAPQQAPTVGRTAMARPSNPAARDRRACLGLQNAIAGAVEMYNLDHNTRTDRLDAAFFRALVDGGYLQQIPEDPGWGPDSAAHYVFDASGNGISCRVHGSAATVEPTQAQLCFANQKLIAGAIEMYNLDNNLRVSAIDATLLKTLVEKGYLEQHPEDPGQGANTGDHYMFDSSGNRIICSVHGSPSGPNPNDTRACYAIQKTLAGALEMYNLDNNTKVETIDQSLLTKLVKDGYLQRIPEDPGQGAGTANHYVFTPSGNGLACRVHGSIR